MEDDFLQRRRADRARARRRRAVRRRLVVGGLLAAIVAVVVVIVLAGSGSSGSSRHPRTSAASVSGHHARARGHSRAAPATHHGVTAASLAAGDGRPGNATVPILMYHVIAAPPAGAPFPGLYVTPSEFSDEMTALKDAGWHGVTLDQLRAYWSGKARLPAGKPVVITFDNGYHSQYTAALPVLRRMGWPADENMQLTGLPPSQGGLTTDEIKAMVGAGWELDTQGISHADLITLDASELQAQVASSRRTIQRAYHVPVNWFCYPSGHYNATVIAAVKAAGYVGSTTVIPGWANRTEDPYRLPRLRVLGGTSGAQLLGQIAQTRSAAAPPPSYGGT